MNEKDLEVSKFVKYIALELDEATDAKNIQRLTELIKMAEEGVEQENAVGQFRLYYSIGTAYGDIYDFTVAIEEVDETKLIQRLYYLRKSIEVGENIVRYEPKMRSNMAPVYVNYGNAELAIGRKVVAIIQYKKALELVPNFCMAEANLGRVYFMYSLDMEDNLAVCYLSYFAHKYLQKTVENKEEATDAFLISEAKRLLDKFDRKFTSEFLEKPLPLKNVDFEDNEERDYKEWLLKNELFLNSLNDLPLKHRCFCVDRLHLPTMKVKVIKMHQFHGMFNQIKQEYIYSRYQSYCGCRSIEGVHYADKGTGLLLIEEDLQYSIRIEMVKSSFKNVYSLFDKIAGFINEYFNLGIEGRKTSFNNIWKSDRLQYKKNKGLHALYWINREFCYDGEFSSNPHAREIKEIRNCLEHRYFNVYKRVFSEEKPLDSEGLGKLIEESDLMNMNLSLLKLMREALIMLAVAVRVEEKQKDERKDEQSFLKYELFEYPDEFKV